MKTVRMIIGTPFALAFLAVLFVVWVWERKLRGRAALAKGGV